MKIWSPCVYGRFQGEMRWFSAYKSVSLIKMFVLLIENVQKIAGLEIFRFKVLTPLGLGMVQAIESPYIILFQLRLLQSFDTLVFRQNWLVQSIYGNCRVLIWRPRFIMLLVSYNLICGVPLSNKWQKRSDIQTDKIVASKK